jgi:tetratricopeptide (TPR) repeat protein
MKVGLIVGGIVVAALVIGWLIHRADRESYPPMPTESRAERHKALSEAFCGDHASVDSPDGRAAAAVLEALRKHICRKNAEQVRKLLDRDQVYRRCRRHDRFPRIPSSERAETARLLVAGLREKLCSGDYHCWDRVDVQHVRRATESEGENADVLVVCARQKLWQFNDTHFRWWMVRTTDGWKVFDMEDLDVGDLWSRETARMYGATYDTHDPPRWTKVAETDMDHVVDALDAKRLDAADARLAGLLRLSLPDHVMADLWNLQAILRFEQGRHEEAIEAIDASLRLRPELLGAYLHRAQALSNLDRHAEALEWIGRYEALLGKGDDSRAAAGLALWKLGRADDARRAYEQGLADNDQSADCLAGLATALPPAERHRIVTRFAKLKDPREAFSQVAQALADAKDAAALSTLVDGYRNRRPADAEVLFYLGVVNYLRGKAAHAAEMFMQYHRRAKIEDDREAALYWYMDCMLALDKPVAAYRRCPDKPLAFTYLCEELHDARKPDLLERLAGAREKTAPTDPMIPLWRAVVARLRGRHDEAIRVLSARRKDWSASDKHVYRFHRALIESLMAAGRFDRALAEAKASTKTDGDPYFEALVHAKRGDVEMTGKTLARLVELDHSPESFYRETILREALNSPAFRALRATYPPPATTTRPTTRPR